MSYQSTVAARIGKLRGKGSEVPANDPTYTSKACRDGSHKNCLSKLCHCTCFYCKDKHPIRS